MAVVQLPSQLRERADGEGQVAVTGSTVGEVLKDLERRHPGLKGWILDEAGVVRRHVNVFVDGERLGADAAVEADAQIQVLPAISGG